MMQLVKDTEIRRYELTYLLPVSFTDSEMNKLTEEIENLLKKNKATDISTHSWGKKKMAYKIKHSGVAHTEAHYLHVTFSAQPSVVQGLEKAVYLHPQVIRHLLVIAQDTTPKMSKSTVQTENTPA